MQPKKKKSIAEVCGKSAEQLLLSGHKSAQVKYITNSINGRRSKQAKKFFKCGDLLPVENLARRQCTIYGQMKTDKRKKFILVAFQFPVPSMFYTMP